MKRTLKTIGKFSLGLSLLSLVTPGCSSSFEDTGINAEADRALSKTEYHLKSFQSCDDFTDAMRKEAEQRLTGDYWGWGGSGGSGIDLRVNDASFAESAPQTAGQDSNDGDTSAASGSTGTNNQESGVQESDVSTLVDGYMYSLKGKQLFIVDVRNAATVDVASKTEFEGFPTQLQASGNRVAIFSEIYERYDGEGNLVAQETEWEQGHTQKRFLKVTVLDVTDKTSPQKLSDYQLENSYYVSSRMTVINDKPILRMATNFYPSLQFQYDVEHEWPGYPCENIKYDDEEPGIDPETSSPPSLPIEETTEEDERSDNSEGSASGAGSDGSEPNPGDGGEDLKSEDSEIGSYPGCDTTIKTWEEYEDMQQASREDYFKKLLAKNSEYLAGLTTSDFLPSISNTDTETSKLVSECGQVASTGSGNGFGITSLTTIDLNAPAELPNGTSILSPGGMVYASQDVFAIVSPLYTHWNWQDFPNGHPLGVWDFTAIHTFDIASSTTDAKYTGSGFVAGSVQSQFWLDEAAGTLRVGSIVTRYTGENWASETTNRLTVLSPTEDGYKAVGKVAGLAKDERIQSMRYIGDDKAYMVTFRQVDPLFAIDLSVPESPKVLGELKISGFSTYMHPLGKDFLLTIGREASDEGQITGNKLQVFDVSNPAVPTLATDYLLSEGWSGDSEALWNHKAFNFLQESETTGKLAIPYSDWNSEAGAKLLVLQVDAKSDIELIGEVSHSNLFLEVDTKESWNYCWGYNQINRSYFVDGNIISDSPVGFSFNKPTGEELHAQTYADDLTCNYYGYSGGGIAVGITEDVEATHDEG